MHSAGGDPGYSPGTGFPIRRSLDQCSFDSSPGLIAAYHVLHRLITPRHPPCTLSSLTASVVGPRPLRRTGQPPWRYVLGEPAYRMLSVFDCQTAAASRRRAPSASTAPRRKPPPGLSSRPGGQRPCIRRLCRRPVNLNSSAAREIFSLLFFVCRRRHGPVRNRPCPKRLRKAVRPRRRASAQVAPPAGGKIFLPPRLDAASRGAASRRDSAAPSRTLPRRTGDERVRTADLLVANQPLSQLSYVPEAMADLRLSSADCPGAPRTGSGLGGPAASGHATVGGGNGPGWSRTNDLALIRGTL